MLSLFFFLDWLFFKEIQGKFNNVTFYTWRQLFIHIYSAFTLFLLNLLLFCHVIIRITSKYFPKNNRIWSSSSCNSFPSLFRQRINTFLISETKMFLPKFNSQFLSRLWYNVTSSIHLSINKIITFTYYCYLWISITH